jgi:large subunit ribosomal protein L24
MIKADPNMTRAVISREKPVPLSFVKLVAALPHPETNVVRDVIVTSLKMSKVWHDKVTGRKSFSRIISGTTTVVPWPKQEPKEVKDYDADTLRIDVETRSFVPSLLRPPMPSTVIDELRNKYSIFRTRHDEEYIAKKIAEEEAEVAQKNSGKLMRTPLNEINRKVREMKKAKGKGKLTEQMLARIGEVMERRKKQALAVGGMTAEAPVSA